MRWDSPHWLMPGTEEVPESIAPYCKDHNAVLLANHFGALTLGKLIHKPIIAWNHWNIMQPL